MNPQTKSAWRVTKDVALKPQLVAVIAFFLGWCLRDAVWHLHEDTLFQSVKFYEDYIEVQRESNLKLSNEVATYAAYIDACRIELGLQPYGTLEVLNQELQPNR